MYKITTLKGDIVKIIRFIFVVAIAGAVYQYVATQSDELAFQPVGKMIDIGGYKLHMIDSQVGKVTVVIDSAIGQKTLDWCLVQPEIAKFARVVTYDRAGYAWSDASPLARTSGNIVQEMRTMLQNAKIPAPYILVGDSFGGMNIRLFADQHSEDVAGLIVINSDRKDLIGQKPGLLNSLWLYGIDVANYTGCLRLLSLLPSQQQKMHDAIASYPAYLKPIEETQIVTTKYVHAMVQEGLLLSQSLQQLQQAQQSLSDKPVVMLNESRPVAIIAAVRTMVDELQARMVK